MKNILREILLISISAIASVVALVFIIFNYEKPEVKLMREMGTGINIGNSLDVHNVKQENVEYEIYWGNPLISQKYIHGIKEAGFNTVRIPISWGEHMDEEGNINVIFIDRVEEVVKMVLKEDLYVIIDTHHEPWIELKEDKIETTSARFEKLWSQIANRFIKYNRKLIFEGMNEPRLRDSELEWTGGNEELRRSVNYLNKIFVKTIRKTGGYNKNRFLIICPYCNIVDKEAMEGLMEENKAFDEYCIVALHYYNPYVFCQKEEGESAWKEEYKSVIEKDFDEVNKIIKESGRQVIFTEYGCKDKDNEADRAEYVRNINQVAGKYNIPLIWWDDGSNYRLIDRNDGAIIFEKITEAMLE